MVKKQAEMSKSTDNVMVGFMTIIFRAVIQTQDYNHLGLTK